MKLPTHSASPSFIGDEHMYKAAEKIEASQATERDDRYETCVLCGRLTNVPRSLHIDFRMGYVEGVGQLCHDCAMRLYGKETDRRRSGNECAK